MAKKSKRAKRRKPKSAPPAPQGDVEALAAWAKAHPTEFYQLYADMASEEEEVAASRAQELVDFLQDVALGKRKATEQEITEAAEKLEQYLRDAEPDDE